MNNQRNKIILPELSEAGVDRVFRLARLWSNRELARSAHHFRGDIANVSGWTDVDKEGHHYRDYFINADSYTITNYKSEARGFQGTAGEIFLDLTAELPQELVGRFDVILNHTVLEHIYEVRTAFANLCSMTKDVAIIIVPFLQAMHADYGDFWRFTPLTMKKMFEENGLQMVYSSFNSQPNASVYLFCIGAKHPERWQDKIGNDFTFEDKYPSGTEFKNWVGCHAIDNSKYDSGGKGLLSLIKRKLRGQRG